MNRQFITRIIIPMIIGAMIGFLRAGVIFPPKTYVSQSMCPILNPGEHVVFWKRPSYKRGDIVLFHGADKYYCLRIIGLPGETVDLLDGGIYINGTKLEEPYLSPYTVTEPAYVPYAVSIQPNTFKRIEKKSLVTHFEIPGERYFVLGDNRKHAFDSRQWSFPFVAEYQIRGKYLTKFGGKEVSY